MTTSDVRVSVSIVNWNQAALLRECLASLGEQTGIGVLEILVVDNASTDGSCEMVRREFPHVRLIENTENVGYGSAHNQAMRQAQGRFVLLLNNDVVMLPESVSRLAEFMEQHPDAGVVGPRLYTDATRAHTQPSAFRTYPTPWNDVLDRVVGRRLRGAFPRSALAHWMAARWNRETPAGDGPRQVAHIVGAVMMTRREVIEQGLFFDEGFEFFFEETDWCWRLCQCGWRIYHVPEVGAIHYYSQSFHQRDDREQIHYASYLRYLRKHAGPVAVGLARILHGLGQARRGSQSASSRIVLASHEFPPKPGGAGRFAEAIANDLVSSDVAVTVLTGACGRESHNGTTYVRRFVRDREPVVLAYLTWRGHIRQALDGGARTVLATDILTQRACALLSKAERRQCMVLAHGSEVLANFQERWPKRMLYTRLYRDAAAIMANSHYTRDLLIQHGIDGAKVFVLYPWLSPDWWLRPSDGARIRERHRLADRRVLLTVGRLSIRKAQDLVIRALPQICEQIPNVIYLIVGAGEQLASLQALARSCGVADRVRCVGAVESLDLMSYYDAADVFVMPSRRAGPLVEGFGIAFLEAQARGKPVIGSRTGGIPEAMRDRETGVLVEPESPEAVAQGVVEVLSDPIKYQAMGQAARAWVAETFTWERASRVLLPWVTGGSNGHRKDAGSSLSAHGEGTP